MYLKASFLTNKWDEFELLETMALDDGEYGLLERHLGRRAGLGPLTLDFAGMKPRSRERWTIHATRTRRDAGVRLVVERDGSAHTEAKSSRRATRHASRGETCISPIDDRDPLVFHKTTARARYELERSVSAVRDVIFWTVRGEVTESTIAKRRVFSEGNIGHLRERPVFSQGRFATS